MAHKEAWRVSLHGGHSGEYCDHAEGTLRQMLEAAVAAGFDTFGVSEHAPRPRAFLYDEERALGWDELKVAADFSAYREALPALAEEFSDRLTVLKGFEAEVVPAESYIATMLGFRALKQPDGSPVFDYFVGSVHYVEEVQVDGPLENYLHAIEVCGGQEAFLIRYYRTVRDMAAALRPDVVGHLDLPRKRAAAANLPEKLFEAPAVVRAMEEALEAVRETGGMLDLNLAGWRKGLAYPYPAPAAVRLAHRMGLAFCFGDDSHRPSEVGAGLERGREYLLDLGIESICCLAEEAGGLVKRTVPLR